MNRMQVESFGRTDIGCGRKDNEDRILVDSAIGLYAVCDGMGGHHHGEFAAELAIAALRRYTEASHDPLDVTWPFGYDFKLSVNANRLVTGIKVANRQIWRRAEQEFEYVGMGTTVAAALVEDEQMAVANVGDSRVYCFSGDSLQQLTEDDTMIGSMLRGKLTDEEFRSHPLRNVLTQAAGAQESVNVHIVERTLSEGDTVLISSDGLHRVLTDEEIAAMLRNEEKAEALANTLIEVTRSRGAPDNVSVIVLRCR